MRDFSGSSSIISNHHSHFITLIHCSMRNYHHDSLNPSSSKTSFLLFFLALSIDRKHFCWKVMKSYRERERGTKSDRQFGLLCRCCNNLPSHFTRSDGEKLLKLFDQHFFVNLLKFIFGVIKIILEAWCVLLPLDLEIYVCGLLMRKRRKKVKYYHA